MNGFQLDLRRVHKSLYYIRCFCLLSLASFLYTKFQQKKLCLLNIVNWQKQVTLRPSHRNNTDLFMMQDLL